MMRVDLTTPVRFTAHTDRHVTLAYRTTHGAEQVREFFVGCGKEAMVREIVPLAKRMDRIATWGGDKPTLLVCDRLIATGSVLRWTVSEDGPLVTLLRREWKARLRADAEVRMQEAEAWAVFAARLARKGWDCRRSAGSGRGRRPVAGALLRLRPLH